MAGWHGRADTPEPPPPGWELLGPKPGWTEKLIESRAEMDALCVARGLKSTASYNKRLAEACADPKTKEVFLLASKAEQQRPHEWVHPWGPVHKPSAREWIWPDGRPVEPLTPSQAALMRAMAEAEVRQQATQAPTGLLALGSAAPR